MDTDESAAQAIPRPLLGIQRRPVAPPGCSEFFRETYRELIGRAMYLGATKPEAEDVAQTTMVDVLVRWDELRDPRAYARRAVINNLIKERTRVLVASTGSEGDRLSDAPALPQVVRTHA